MLLHNPEEFKGDLEELVQEIRLLLKKGKAVKVAPGKDSCTWLIESSDIISLSNCDISPDQNIANYLINFGND